MCKSRNKEPAMWSVSSTNSETDPAAHAAHLYKSAKTDELAPLLKESHLKEAIVLWNKLVSSSHASATLQKNLGLANKLLGELSTTSLIGEEQYVLEHKMRNFHLHESMNHFMRAHELGVAENRSSTWLDELLARCSDTFHALVHFRRLRSSSSSDPPSSSADLALLDSRIPLRLLALKLPSSIQAEAMYELVCVLYHGGLALLEASIQEFDMCKNASRIFHELYRPLEETKQLFHRNQMSLSWHASLLELEQDVLLHKDIVESRLALHKGDALLLRAVSHGETLSMEDVWTCLDHFKHAEVITRGRDVETEAMAIARRANVYAKVFRNESLARPLLMQAITLATSLSPRSFHGVEWYDRCVATLSAYQKREADLADKAEAKRRAEEAKIKEPVLKKLKPELDGVKKAAAENGPYKLMEYVYKNHPPKCNLFLKDKEKVLANLKAANADNVKSILLTALLHYHPDKNGEDKYGVEWLVLCEEITRALNNKFELLKG